MYKIGGILFMILQGFLCAQFGWIALLWCPLGFMFGIFSTSNIVLPILIGFPLATSLIFKKRMRAGIYLALLRAPIIWFVILFLIGFFFPSAANWVWNNQPLNIAANLGFLLILLSPISKKVRDDFRSDFDKTWGKYYTDYIEDKTELASSKDKKQAKQVEYGVQVFSNLYNSTAPKEGSDLKFKLPDSRHRYMIFCMSTFLKCSSDILYEDISFIGDCLHFISQYMSSKENTEEFFSGKVSLQEAKARSEHYITEYINNWASYNKAFENDEYDKALSILSNMIHSTETDEPLNQNNTKRLDDISKEIDEFIMPAMRRAFVKLSE